MAKARIGHFAEAQVLAALGVDYIDESEVLTPADEAHHIDKWPFTVPFVCGATNLGEALRRISEGAAMIRSKGEAGTGNIVEAVRHLRSILGDIRKVTQADSAEQYGWAKELAAPIGLVQEIATTGRLPVPLFCAGGHRHPGRRRTGHAARRRGGLRRFGHLQERRPGADGPGHRRGDRPLRRRRPGGQGLDRAGSGHGRARRSTRSVCIWPSVAGDRSRPGHRARPGAGPVTVGVLALQGDVREHAPRSATRARRCARCGVPGDLDGIAGIVLPGGESTTLSLLLASAGLVEPLDRAWSTGPARCSAPVRG